MRAVNRFAEGTEWVFSGERGAVSFLVFTDEKAHDFTVPAVIGIHDPARREDFRRDSCDLLPGGKCYQRQLDGLELLAASRGRDDDVIFGTLEGCYRAFLGRGGK